VNHSFNGRVALVTGGASGIGRATGLAFAQAGTRLMLADIDEIGGAESVALIEAGGGEAHFLPTDVSQPAQVAALLAATIATYGQLDFALNNAGLAGVRAKTADYPEAEWQRLVAVNLSGVWSCMRYEIPPMLRQGRGVIVNLASVAGLVGFPGYSAYAATKHAVIGLTKTAALEYIRQGIRVNAVCPAFTDTPMLAKMIAETPAFQERLVAAVPARRLGTPAEVAAAVLYLCSDEAAFITGQTLTLDGGITAG
jgi:NAD(P)-dependent dehydrogenase (short-subunit alcohol dehydrogenase family)